MPSDNVKAVFELYRPLVVGETKDTTLKVNGNNVDVKKVGTYTTDNDGKININTKQSGDNDRAFSNGVYYFVEVFTATGYNLLKEPAAVRIEFYYEKEPRVTYYKDSAKTLIATTTTTSINVVNKKGFLLPTTGGAGTLVFSIVGIILMGVAVIVFFGVRKRKNG